MNGAEAMRRLRRKRMLNNICTRCGCKNDTTGTQCSKCRQYHIDKRRERRQYAIEQGWDKRIRKLKKWKISNYPLFFYLFENKISISEFANKVGVTSRQVQRWIFENSRPNLTNRMIIEDITGKDLFQYD